MAVDCLKNGENVTKLPLGVTTSPAAIATMKEDGARLKWKVSARAKYLGGQPHRRRLVGTIK